MSWTARACVVAAALAVLVGADQLTVSPALADNPQPQELHNITYRARITGLARGALITYAVGNGQVQTANPVMLPGRTFEADTVLADPKQAGMQVSIQWPYSASLHCEILVDDETSAAANQFIAPTIGPADDDPDYGTLSCGAPINSNASASGTATDTAPGGADAPPPAPAPAN